MPTSSPLPGLLSRLARITESLDVHLRDSSSFATTIQSCLDEVQSLAKDVAEIEEQDGESSETGEFRMRTAWALERLKRCQTMPSSRKRTKVLALAVGDLKEIPGRLEYLRDCEVGREEREEGLRRIALEQQLPPGERGREYVVPRAVTDSHHVTLNFEKWCRITNETGRNAAEGTVINGPEDICSVERAREKRYRDYDLGEAVPVDMFVWQVAPPREPFLTRLGGVPYRSRNEAWPVDTKGIPFTFVAQFCFLDSRDVLPIELPGDVLLVFMRQASSFGGWRDEVHLEWSKIGISQRMSASDCPSPSFAVPELTGVIHRSYEFPDSSELFQGLGHDQPYLLATTQGTKIGTETWFIQGDPRPRPDATLLCALNSLEPSRIRPFVDLEELPADHTSCRDDAELSYGWSKYSMSFADCGCMYFFLDEDGNTSSYGDCY